MANIVGELNSSEPLELERIFNYKILEKEEFDEHVENVVKEYKKGNTDPIVAKYTNQFASKTRKRHVSRTKK